MVSWSRDRTRESSYTETIDAETSWNRQKIMKESFQYFLVLQMHQSQNLFIENKTTRIKNMKKILDHTKIEYGTFLLHRDDARYFKRPKSGN